MTKTLLSLATAAMMGLGLLAAAPQTASAGELISVGQSHHSGNYGNYRNRDYLGRRDHGQYRRNLRHNRGGWRHRIRHWRNSFRRYSFGGHRRCGQTWGRGYGNSGHHGGWTRRCN